MTEDGDREIESRLRDALRPLDPPEDFTRRVLAAVAREAQERRTQRRRLSVQRLRLPWIGAAMAAALTALAIGAHQWRESRERLEGMQAREDLMEALRVTSEKLDIAYDVVNAPRANSGDEPIHDS